ncbi:MAG: histone deacetylase [Planctomycetaceae bacterium]|nr:histone deacetylase [Planctomycetaceae bacterium]
MKPPPAPQLYADSDFLEHRTGDHPESPERLRHLYAWLADRPVKARYAPGEFAPANREQLERVHDPAYLDHVRDFAAKGGGRIEADTVVSRRSYEVAAKAAGAAVAAVDAVVTGAAPRAVCLVRPPGHHALVEAPMGFCLFNNVAVAARHALVQHRLKRLLIVDWDVHHGNGTQDIFYQSGDAWFFSVHRSPFYPGTGAAHETGQGDGLGTKFNLPLAYGTTRQAFREKFQTTLEQAAAKCQPELILISAGFDAHAADPIGSLGLETEDFEPLTKLVGQVADQYCGGKIVSLLEGGYNIEKLADCVECHMQALL